MDLTSEWFVGPFPLLNLPPWARFWYLTMSGLVNNLEV